jgi:hypothetical protein
LKIFRGNTNAILEMLESDKIEVFYKIFNAKEYGGTLPERQNINPKDLSKTNWFKEQIVDVLG